MIELNVCVQDFNYNFEWLNDITSKEELQEGISNFLKKYNSEEYEIVDIEGISYNESPFEFLELLEEYSSEQDTIELMLNAGMEISDIQDCMENENYYIYYNCSTPADVEMEFLEETGYFESVPDDIQRYFDFEAYARDMECSGICYYFTGDTCIKVY